MAEQDVPIDVYVCDKTGITGLELTSLSMYFIHDDKAFLNQLTKYGETEQEIVAYMFEHINECDKCGSEYAGMEFVEQQLKENPLLRLEFRDLVADILKMEEDIKKKG